MNRLRARRRILTLALLAACTTVAVSAVEPATADDRTRAEITALLTSFLSPERNPTRAKAEILASFDEPPKREPAKPAEPEPVYSAEDILVRPYGEMAALTFRLVARAADGTTQSYRNSGTFLRRAGKWQAITWQATKVPPAEK